MIYNISPHYLKTKKCNVCSCTAGLELFSSASREQLKIMEINNLNFPIFSNNPRQSLVQFDIPETKSPTDKIITVHVECRALARPLWPWGDFWGSAAHMSTRKNLHKYTQICVVTLWVVCGFGSLTWSAFLWAWLKCTEQLWNSVSWCSRCFSLKKVQNKFELGLNSVSSY